MNQIEISPEKQGASYELARFATRLRYEDLPEDVVQKAKQLILDQLGAQLAASTMPWCRAVYEYAKEINAPGHTTVVNYGFRTHPEFAALVNATFGHGFEVDDYYGPAPAHAGCVAVPVALALGEEVGAGGKDAILGVVIGLEVILRVALAAGRSMVIDRGFHETSAEGVFGAAVAAGRMLNLSEEGIVNALGIAASHASGVMEYTQSGGEVKRFHAGIGAGGGIRSALLARKGLTGPATALEGKRGMFQAFTNKFDAGQLTEGLGKDYKIFDVALKPYAVPATMNLPIVGVTSLIAEHGLKPDDIKDIEVATYGVALWQVGSVGPRPKNVTEAQFNVHFGLGLTVVKGANSFEVYKEQMEQGFRDPQVLAIADKVRIVLDKEANELYPKKRIARVTIQTNDGRSLSTRIEGCKGLRENPLSQQEVEDKFRGLASTVLPEKRSQEIIKVVANLEKLEQVSQLTHLLVA